LTLHNDKRNIYKDRLLGVAVGDALGVPGKFKIKQTIVQKPVTDRIGSGTYNLEPGTFSDDSSLAFCLAEALPQGFSLKKIRNNFVGWLTIIMGHPAGLFLMLELQQAKQSDRLQPGHNPELARVWTFQIMAMVH
jgi:ADP-ribosylglycohydrolase